MIRSLFARKDKSTEAPIPIGFTNNPDTYRKALELNQKQYGIFWTVNEMHTFEKRTNDNVKKILSWAVDIDEGSKKQQAKIICKAPQPSLIVESARGFHVYYNAKNPEVDSYAEILQYYLIPNLRGDMKAKDLARILRAPDFYHHKAEPFLCRIVEQCECEYTEEQIKFLFKRISPKPQLELQKNYEREKINQNYNTEKKIYETVMSRIYRENQADLLLRLSGSKAVMGETFDFKQNSNGNLNLIVDGKMTSVFIDKKGLIGSSDHGGPTVLQFCNWYHNNPNLTYKLVKEVLPEFFGERK